MAYANTFKRREMKFLLNKEQYEEICKRIVPYMTEDDFGKHTILNIYLDNCNDDLIRSSLGKPVYKEKLRLRTYNEAYDDSKAFLEIKKKLNGITYKRRYELTYKKLFDYITYGSIPLERGQVFEEIDYMIKRMSLVPRIVICYDREAYYGNDDNEFRLTFDDNLRYRYDELDLRLGDHGKRLIITPYKVMEVKSAGAIPFWLAQTLSELKVYAGAFSKYGTIYQKELKGQRLAASL